MAFLSGRLPLFLAKGEFGFCRTYKRRSTIQGRTLPLYTRIAHHLWTSARTMERRFWRVRACLSDIWRRNHISHTEDINPRIENDYFLVPFWSGRNPARSHKGKEKYRLAIPDFFGTRLGYNSLLSRVR